MDGVVHSYIYASGKLLRETYGNNVLDFFYDSNGTPFALKYNGTVYYYITNLQGDVMNLVDANGTVVATYDYDPFGNVIGLSGTMATTNPLRYRGYYYDSELGLYYLQSRYYDPELGRFINADSQINTSLGSLGLNQFSYCLNNPVNLADYCGNKPGDLFDSMDEAARDFAEYINETSIEANREYASYIYTKTVWETKTVTYSNPNPFSDGVLSRLWKLIFGDGISQTVIIHVRVTKYTYVKPSKGTTDSSTIPRNWFGWHNQVALLHTHGAYSPRYRNDDFSSQDKNLASRKNMPIYVATPLGTLRKYDPSNGTDILLFDDLPFDPNHPGR